MKEKFQKIIIIMLICISLFVMYSKYIRKDKIVTLGGYSFFIVLTGSMEPELKTNSLIIVKKCDIYNVRRYNYIFRK